MPQESQSKHHAVEELARRTQGADAARIAAVVTAAMGAIDASLRPVIGSAGVQAMYRCGLVLVAASHPWLAPAPPPLQEIDLAALQALLAGRDAADAAGAGGALLQAFCDLLASLVGDSLGERLLRDVWPAP